MTDWKTYKSQTPFQFVVAPSESYNEGNKIAFSPKIPGKSPVWSMERSRIPITPTHTPCRYWTGEGWEYIPWIEKICVGLEIAYTKTIMALNEQQVLQIKDSNGDITDVDIVVWFLAGVGSITADIGSSITYTAPSVNITESDTAVIEMWCNGEVKDTLTISFAGKITYTTPQQPPDTDQVFNIDNPNPGCTYTWELTGGGSLSTYTGPTTTFTAPTTNPNCENNATISLLCNGVVVDTLHIAITSVTVGLAYRALSCRYEGSCEVGTPFGTTYNSAYVWIDRYLCDGTYNGHETSVCYVVGGACSPPMPTDCEGCAATQHFTACGVTYDNSNRSTCEGTALKCGTLCIWGLGPGALIGEPLDSRTPEQKAAGCCPAALL